MASVAYRVGTSDGDAVFPSRALADEFIELKAENGWARATDTESLGTRLRAMASEYRIRWQESAALRTERQLHQAMADVRELIDAGYARWRRDWFVVSVNELVMYGEDRTEWPVTPQ